MTKATLAILDLSFYVFFCISYLADCTAHVRKESVSSSGSPPIVTGLLFFMLAVMTFVLLLLMLSPVCVDTVIRCSVSLLSGYDCDRKARSSAKSKSSNWSKESTGYNFSYFL